MRLAAAILVSAQVAIMGGSALAQPARPLAAREQLLAADRNFSKLSQQRGRAYAFLVMAAGNARLFGAEGAAPIYGRAQAFRALSRGQNSRMRWEPQAAGVSGDGRMGWTDGRWEIAGRGAPVASGHYLTVWAKDRRGAWKVQANMNTSDPAKK
jgi:ketosteroid isomerase-like protein